MGALKSRLTEVEELIRAVQRRYKRWNLDIIESELRKHFPTHNIQHLVNTDQPHLGKIIFDGREIFKGYEK